MKQTSEKCLRLTNLKNDYKRVITMITNQSNHSYLYCVFISVYQSITMIKNDYFDYKK